jgi:hypothetical protein
MSTSTRATVLSLVIAMTTLAGPGARAQEQQYLLLMNRFGELCTMCEAVVLCAAGDVPPADVADLARPGIGPFTIYHFRTKTFWGQVATIWDYLIRWVEPVIREERPVRIYRVGADGAAGSGRSLEERMANLSIDPPLLDIGDRRINRQSGAWETPRGQAVGSCARLPIREGLGFVTSHSPWPAAAEE